MSVRAPQRQSGFTMIEIVASVAIFATVIAVAMHSSLLAGRVTAGLVSSSDLDLLAHRVVKQVSRELLQARAETLTPDPVQPAGAAALTYERAEVGPGGTIEWSTPRRIEFVQASGDPLDGIDNDRNGLVDDGEIWLVTDVGLPGEQRSLLARHVAGFLEGEDENVLDDNQNGLIDERGLNFEMRDGVLLVRVSVQSIDPQRGLATRTAETAIRLRN